jgi:hypothetical protein
VDEKAFTGLRRPSENTFNHLPFFKLFLRTFKIGGFLNKLIRCQRKLRKLKKFLRKLKVSVY